MTQVAMAYAFNGAIVTSRALGPQTKVADASNDGEVGSRVVKGGGVSSALFETACRCSHSCQPNSCWFSDSAGLRTIRALSNIGEVNIELKESICDIFRLTVCE